MPQIHVEVNPEFYLRFKEALKRKGEFKTLSEMVRSAMREYIKQAEAELRNKNGGR